MVGKLTVSLYKNISDPIRFLVSPKEIQLSCSETFALRSDFTTEANAI